MLRDVNTSEIEVITVNNFERLFSPTTSKGNQIKWKCGNRYIKLNTPGCYESVAEVLVSHLLDYTDIQKEDYVKYYSCIIVEDGVELGLGCYSEDFKKGWTEVTAAKVLQSTLSPFSIHQDEFRELILDELHIDCKDYLDRLLCLDSITRNDDRHFGNIVFLEKDGIYKPAPIFDNGSSCMSDTGLYLFKNGFNENYKLIRSKPFSGDFLTQIKNNNRITIDVDGFYKSVTTSTRESARAMETIKRGLEETEGISWVRS